MSSSTRSGAIFVNAGACFRPGEGTVHVEAAADQGLEQQAVEYAVVFDHQDRVLDRCIHSVSSSALRMKTWKVLP
jgi:hypothetical protein